MADTKDLVAHVVRRRFRKHNSCLKGYQVKVINNIIFNDKSVTTSLFKEKLVIEDRTDFLKRLYKRDDLNTRLVKIFDFYENYSKIFPNYTVVPHSKYFYRNIQKKQKMIDNLEAIAEEEELNKNKRNNSLKYVITEQEQVSIENQSMLGCADLSLDKIEKLAESINSIEQTCKSRNFTDYERLETDVMPEYMKSKLLLKSPIQKVSMNSTATRFRKMNTNSTSSVFRSTVKSKEGFGLTRNNAVEKPQVTVFKADNMNINIVNYGKLNTDGDLPTKLNAAKQTSRITVIIKDKEPKEVVAKHRVKRSANEMLLTKMNTFRIARVEPVVATHRKNLSNRLNTFKK